MNILEERRRVLGGEVYKKTAEGNPVSVRSLARMRPGLSIMGKSTQQTTTGAQLIPFEVGQQIVSRNGYVKGTITENGIQIEASDGSDISNDSDLYMVGSFDSLNKEGYREVDTLPPGKYKLSCSDQDYILYVVVWRNGASVIIGNSSSENIWQFTVEDGDKFRIFLRPTYSGITGIKNVKFIVEKEDNNIDWEPYTGGQPSPSPDYPQEITSAGDDGSIDVDITGANLFDISKATPSTSRPYKLDISKDDEYIYVTGNPNSVNTILSFRILSYPTLIYDNRFSADFAESQGINAAVSHVYQNNYDMSIALRIRLLEAGNPINLKFKIMVNEGNETLPYEPYKQPQSLTVQTPNGLPGIPVQSGGNYTDENGQQWICDEIDFKRGKYVQRVYLKHYGNDELHYNNATGSGEFNIFTYIHDDKSIINGSGELMVDVGMYDSEYLNDNAFRSVIAGLRGRVDKIKSFDDIKQIFPNGINALFVRLTPVETDLSEEQLSAYANLHTNRPTTIVSATDDAGIKLTYKTKKSLEVTD